MKTLTYTWHSADAEQSLELVRVAGTVSRPYTFGEESQTRTIDVPDFFIAAVPVTQALWTHVMGAGNNPASQRGERRPVENVSWDQITGHGGFFERINAGGVLAEVMRQLRRDREFPVDAKPLFRLPSETEWEYAARGGPHWTDGFCFSGGKDIEAVAWYQNNSWDQMHDVAQKAPNQLGLYDMSGNAWEWCQDCHTHDVADIPADGSHYVGDSSDRILRGGCYHNWAIHCTVSKRYEIDRAYHDGCIGFRVVLSLG